MHSTLVFFLIFILFIIFKLYLKLSTGWCKNKNSLVDKTVIVSGANAGIGFETALDFAKRGAKVILACRDYNRAAEARRLIIEKTNNTNIHIKIIDLSSFESVRAFAKDINENEDRLDILVNNAAAALLTEDKTQDGHYVCMQVNYFSMFLLTNLLLELMQKTGSSRVVNVSSIMARFAFRFNLNDLCKHLGDVDMYIRTKLCIILFTKELARRLRNTNVTTYSLHPGTVKTDIFEDTKKNMATYLFFYPAQNWFSKTPEAGAQTSIYCSVEKNIEKYSGRHFEDCQSVGDYYTVRVAGLAERLWNMTEKIVGLDV